MAQLAHKGINMGSNDSFKKENRWIPSPHSQAHPAKMRKAQPCNPNFAGRACLFAIAFLPTLKTNFFGNGSASNERVDDYKRLIIN